MNNILFLSGFILTILSGCKSDHHDDEVVSDEYKTYYVATTGNDENDGSSDYPVKTINHALSKARPGDTVMLRGGTYHQFVMFSQSGLLDKNITLKGYPGETAKIDGTGLAVSGWTALVTIRAGRFITIEGLDICNLTNTSPNSDPEGISISGESWSITIRNCNIYNIKSSSPSFTNDDWRSAHAIYIMGNGSAPATNIVIEGCHVYEINTGTSETITLAGNIDGFTIRNNKVHDVENIGIIIAGGDNLNSSGDISTNFARNGLVCDNEIYNCSHTRSPEVWGASRYGAIGLYVCGGASTIIERNKVYNCDRGIGLVSESDLLATKDCIVRNNFVYHCWRTGIYMGDYLNYTNGGTDNCQVVNNTLFYNNAVLGAFDEIEGEIRLTKNCTNNTIVNNVIYARPTDVFIHKYTATGSNNIIDYNHYYTTGKSLWIWNDVEYDDFGSWKKACGGDAASVSGTDPLLVSTTIPDLHIRPSSPVKNTGVIISQDINGTTDIDGNPRITDDRISKGAQQ